MMETSPPLEKRIKAFAELGKVLQLAAENYTDQENGFQAQFPALFEALQFASHHNTWFTPENISFALNTWKEALSEESISAWIRDSIPGFQLVKPKQIAIIMAGNIPLVGFHDFLCTLMAGHRVLGKLSSDDKILLPAIADVLCQIEPQFLNLIQFTESTLSDFDAVIATGSNNTARYFEFYFSKYPHIIRKNRNGVAVLSGNESDQDYKKLGTDICMHFGLGCRNVSKVFIPEGFAPEKLFKAIEHYYSALNNHHKFMNNHSYNSSVYLLNSVKHLDNNVFILTESEHYSSPIPVLYYQFYRNIETLKEKLIQDDEMIQCIANDIFTNNKTVALGCTQSPGLADYADGIDTMKFLLEL